jgi:hypothetical protein
VNIEIASPSVRNDSGSVEILSEIKSLRLKTEIFNISLRHCVDPNYNTKKLSI